MGRLMNYKIDKTEFEAFAVSGIELNKNNNIDLCVQRVTKKTGESSAFNSCSVPFYYDNSFCTGISHTK